MPPMPIKVPEPIFGGEMEGDTYIHEHHPAVSPSSLGEMEGGGNRR